MRYSLCEAEGNSMGKHEWHCSAKMCRLIIMRLQKEIRSNRWYSRRSEQSDSKMPPRHNFLTIFWFLLEFSIMSVCPNVFFSATASKAKLSLRNVVMVDETWIQFVNSESNWNNAQWWTLCNRKFMPAVFWRGILLVEFMQLWTTITRTTYCDILKRIPRAIQNKRRCYHQALSLFMTIHDLIRQYK